MKVFSALAAAAALALALLPATPAFAHEVRPAYLELREVFPGRFQVLWKVPRRGDYVLSLRVRWPEGAHDVAPPSQQVLGDAMLERRVMEFGRGGLVGRTLEIDGLPLVATDALVRISFLDGHSQSHLLKPGAPRFTVPARRAGLAVLRDYFGMGVEHILSGFDHLLFVFGLLLLVGGSMRLLKTITAFTLAHSITLGLATLGVVHVPQQPVEAVIALSIVFLARELIEVQRGRPGVSARRPWLMSFAFGLLHGFGFAGALTAIGLPGGDVPLALAGFNLGVEAGQLLFVGAALLLLAGARRAVPHALVRFRTAPAWGIGSLAAFWTIARVAAFR